LLSGCQLVTVPVTAVYSSLHMLGENGPVEARGEVLDESGRPLDGVHLTIHRSWQSGIETNPMRAIPYSHATEVCVLSGHFRVEYPCVSGLSLIFEKPGYARQFVYVNRGEGSVERRHPDAPSGPAAAALLADPRSSRPRSLRVVLEGQPAAPPGTARGARWSCRS
jgi:hypothetical protein